ncbi:hypothetical protein NHQ30_010799 [Ciborinia camelliae]|nr:hypothetical protein NHQ30_010799 [Ciborinia camelliae]
MGVSQSPLKLIGLSKGAANGVQTIVNLQFRKEHRALLNLFEDLKTRVDKASADAERRVEESEKQLEETDNRLKKLENEYRDLMQKNREWEDEVKDLKGRMMRLGDLMRAGGRPTSVSSHCHPDGIGLQRSQLLPITAPPTHDRRDFANLQHSKSTSPIASSQSGLEMPALGQLPSTYTSKQPEPVPQSASIFSPTSNTTLEDRDHHVSNNHESNQAMLSLAHNIQTKLPSPPSPLTGTPANEGMSSLSGKPLRRATSRKVVTSPPWHNISQAPDQNVETYLAYAAEYIGAIKQRKTQFEFIARFIRGLRDERDRHALLKHLQKKFSSRTTKDGFVEVMCGFADVGDGLAAAGLLGSRNGKRDGDDAGMDDVEMDGPLQKRRKTLGSQLSEEDDDEL